MIREYRLSANKIDSRNSEEEPKFNLSFNLEADQATVEAVERGIRQVLSKCDEKAVG